MVAMEIDREKIKEVAEKYDLEFVVLFGSQATGQTHQKSDVDLGVISRSEVDWGKLFVDTNMLIINDSAMASPENYR